MKFKKFEAKYYDFYRFNALVIDLLVHPQNISIPYDMLMQIVFNAYKRHNKAYNMLKDTALNAPDFNPYDFQVQCIENDAELMAELKRCNENKVK